MAAIDELISTYLTACEVEGKTANTVTRFLSAPRSNAVPSGEVVDLGWSFLPPSSPSGSTRAFRAAGSVVASGECLL